MSIPSGWSAFLARFPSGENLGVVMDDLLTGKPPVKRATPLATALAHLRESVPLPKTINPTISDAMQSIVLKCLARSPLKRFRSARELFQALLAYEGEQQRTPATPHR